MKEYLIDKRDDGRKLEKWLVREMPCVSVGMRRKFFRLKRYKINGKSAHENAQLHTGDVVQIYLNDELFEKPLREDPFLSKLRPHLSILYEDEHILLADKRPGLMAHPDANEKVNTLITHVQAYLYQKGEYDPASPSAFAPVLCNRLDRFTGGIEIIAKTREAMHRLNSALRERELGKYYYCLALGQFARREGLLESYIIKESGTKKVCVSDRPAEHAQLARTRYRVLCTKGEINLLECELLTGRTHQIRAQLAHAGHPLLGDNQYGDMRRNMRYARSQQALYAYKLQFRFEGDAAPLEQLNGREFCVRDVRFVREFFPDYRI